MIKWENIGRGVYGVYADTAHGRYMIKREHKGLRILRVYLNDRGTRLRSVDIEELKREVEGRFIEAKIRA